MQFSCVPVVLVTMLLVALDFIPAVAQQVDLDAIHKGLYELLHAGNYPAALAEAQKLEAGVKARVGVNHPAYAVALADIRRRA